MCESLKSFFFTKFTYKINPQNLSIFHNQDNSFLKKIILRSCLRIILLETKKLFNLRILKSQKSCIKKLSPKQFPGCGIDDLLVCKE